MAERRNVQVRIDADVWERFEKFVVEAHGQKYGNLGREAENALIEYMDEDRAARIEEKVDRVLAHVADGSAAHTHKQSRASETVEKAREIHRRVADNHGTIIKEADLVRAIEDIAGADDRTVEKYKEILKRRELIFAHPGDSAVWTVERERWIDWTEDYIDNNPMIDVHDVLEGYSMDVDDYDELVAA